MWDSDSQWQTEAVRHGTASPSAFGFRERAPAAYIRRGVPCSLAARSVSPDIHITAWPKDRASVSGCTPPAIQPLAWKSPPVTGSASFPRSAASASWKSPVEMPRAQRTCKRASRLLVRRAYFGRIAEEKRIRYLSTAAPRSPIFTALTPSGLNLRSGA